MIVACTSCPAQYSVPDAKIRGKKVRITCKHCGSGFVVDATDEPVRAELRLDALEALAPSSPPPPSEDATRMMPKRVDFSVHDEPTVIGQIPAAALAAERAFSQRTMPPPSDEEEAGQAPRALPHDVPEGPLDVTDIASPQAKRASQGSLPPPQALPILLPATSARASRPSLPPQPAAEVKTMLSRDLELPRTEARPRAPYFVLAALAVAALVLFMLTRR